MTDKKDARTEALRLADRLDCDATDADMGRKPIACTRRRAAVELRRQHAEIQQLKAEKAEMAALNYENYEFQRKKADAATATVYRFHYAMKDAGWHPGRTDDDLTDIIREKGRELAQLSARQAAPDGWRLVPVEVVNLYDFMCLAFVPMTGQHEQIAISLKLAKAAMLSAAPPQPEREPLTDDGRYTITIEHGAAQARFVITEMQFESAPSPAEYVGHAVAKAIAAIDKRRVSHGIGATNG